MSIVTIVIVVILIKLLIAIFTPVPNYAENLREKFISIGNLKDKHKSEITNVVGLPQSISTINI